MTRRGAEGHALEKKEEGVEAGQKLLRFVILERVRTPKSIIDLCLAGEGMWGQGGLSRAIYLEGRKGIARLWASAILSAGGVGYGSINGCVVVLVGSCVRRYHFWHSTPRASFPACR